MTFPLSFTPTERAAIPSLIADQLQRLVPRDDTAQPQDAGDESRHGSGQLRSDAACPVGGLHFKADAHCRDLLVHAHLPESSLLAPSNPTATVASAALVRVSCPVELYPRGRLLGNRPEDTFLTLIVAVFSCDALGSGGSSSSLIRRSNSTGRRSTRSSKTTGWRRRSCGGA